MRKEHQGPLSIPEEVSFVEDKARTRNLGAIRGTFVADGFVQCEKAFDMAFEPVAVNAKHFSSHSRCQA